MREQRTPLDVYAGSARSVMHTSFVLIAASVALGACAARPPSLRAQPSPPPRSALQQDQLVDVFAPLKTAVVAHGGDLGWVHSVYYSRHQDLSHPDIAATVYLFNNGCVGLGARSSDAWEQAWLILGAPAEPPRSLFGWTPARVRDTFGAPNRVEGDRWIYLLDEARGHEARGQATLQLVLGPSEAPSFTVNDVTLMLPGHLPGFL
jgi:hypothetical protein